MAGPMRGTQFPKWIANPMLVWKEHGTMQICIDFTYLNKACPKYSLPIPKIENKIESLGGFKWKSILGAYKGYDQVKMAIIR